MKDFLKTTLAVIVGVFICSLICLMLTFAIIGGMASSGKSEPVIPKEGGVMVVDLSKISITEQTQEANPMASLSSMAPAGLLNVSVPGASVGILDAVRAVNAAAEDPAVKYIYLKPDGSTTELVLLQEFRKSLENFRKSGKPVVAYTENLSTSGYYLASVSDKIYMISHIGGSYNFNGVSSQLVFLKDLLDKLGVNMQLIRHGKYKSAGEMYIRSESSPENLEQNQVMINSMWRTISTDIAASRGMSPETLNSIIDNMELCEPQDFLDKGFVDGLLTREELHQKLADLAVVDKFKDLKAFSLADYATAKVKNNFKAKKKLAIIYAEGEIVDGSSKDNVAGDRFASMIAKVREDSTVKAVVLRVNSPGGSVVASEKIKAELDLLAEGRTVVTSYGSYAASGGYWISSNFGKIYTDPATLTGSIGVFGLIPDFSKTIKNIAHVNITSVNSNKHSDFGNLTRPLDKVETDYMYRSIEDIYSRFLSIVSTGRSMSTEDVDEIAQGRVWCGVDAIGIGLVDEIGSLEDAVNWVIAEAGDADLSNWNIAGYPKPKSSQEMLMDMFNTGNKDANVFAGTFLEGTASTLLKLSTQKEPQVLARMPYDIVIR